VGAGAGAFPVNLIPPVIAFLSMEKEDLFFAGARKTGSAEGDEEEKKRGEESRWERVCVREGEMVCAEREVRSRDGREKQRKSSTL
jgi:hypothetical protein